MFSLLVTSLPSMVKPLPCRQLKPHQLPKCSCTKLLTDRGTNVKPKLTEKLCKDLYINKVFTSS